MKKSRLCAIVGPNASGKSDMAIAVAQQVGGEIISADSRQVYREMDLGSGKVSRELQESEGHNLMAFDRTFFCAPLISSGIRHWLIDVVDPRDPFTVAEYQQLAYALIDDMHRRGIVPVLAGGTGLYIRAVLDGLSFPQVPPDERLRMELEACSTEELTCRLFARDPEAGNTVDLMNRRRMIRALEILNNSDASLAELKTTRPVPFESITLGISMPREVLHERIRRRLMTRFEQGMTEEIKVLLERGVTGERLISFGLEYRYIYLYLDGKLTYDVMVEDLYHAICRFAKRQLTWFRKYGSVQWISSAGEALLRIQEFLETSGE
jgi:tRNA dimethylallyltransferase